MQHLASVTSLTDFDLASSLCTGLSHLLFVRRIEFHFHSVEIDFGGLPTPDLSFARGPWFGYHGAETNSFGLAAIDLNFAE